MTDGLTALNAEMARQFTDAQASFDAALLSAAKIAERVKASGRLLLLGMGGSHFAGRMVEPLYRSQGIDAVAMPLSEYLGQPVPLAGRVVGVTSQSGESAEVVRWFRVSGIPDNAFGLTMEAGSTLAKAIPSLIGLGGTEIPFAATRSLMVTLALHGAILQNLSGHIDSQINGLPVELESSSEAALTALGAVQTVVTSGRGLYGVAEAIALGLTELARLPCYALEGGQFRHGPIEMLGPNVGVVLFRCDEPTADLVAALARTAREAGSPVVIVDASGRAPIEGVVTIRLAAADGLAAVMTTLAAGQRLMVDFAATRVAHVGRPVRSTKVLRAEV